MHRGLKALSIVLLCIYKCNGFHVNRVAVGPTILARRSGPPSLVQKTINLNGVISKDSQDSSFTYDKLFLNVDEKWLSRATLLTVSAFYGTNFGCVKILDEALSPSVAAALRFSLAASIFLPYLIKLGRANPELVKGGVEVGVYSSLGYYSQAVALQTTSASSAAFICSLAVIVVPILDTMFGDKSKRDANLAWYLPLLPAVLAASGVGCLELGGVSAPGVGDLWACLQPIFFGLGFWRIESHMKNAKLQGETQAFTGAMLLMVATCAVIWSLNDFIAPLMSSEGHNMESVMSAVAEQAHAFSDWRVGAAVLWTGVVTTAITSFGENMAMKKLSASESTIIYSTEPLWGTAFAALALHEQIGANTIVGAVLILSACLWSSIGVASLIPALASAQIALSEVIEEVGENVSINFNSLFEKITETPGDI